MCDGCYFACHRRWAIVCIWRTWRLIAPQCNCFDGIVHFFFIYRPYNSDLWPQALSVPSALHCDESAVVCILSKETVKNGGQMQHSDGSMYSDIIYMPQEWYRWLFHRYMFHMCDIIAHIREILKSNQQIFRLDITNHYELNANEFSHIFFTFSSRTHSTYAWLLPTQRRA